MKNLKYCRKYDLSAKFSGSSITYHLIMHGTDLVLGYLKIKTTGDSYLYKWIDSNKKDSYWLYFKVSDADLTLFFNKEVTLLDLINKNEEVYIRSFNTQLICPVNKIHSDYLPTENSFFDEKHYTNETLQLKFKLNDKGTNFITSC